MIIICTSTQGSCWRLPEIDDSKFCWVVIRLAYSGTESVVWTAAGCRTEAATGAAGWIGAGGVTEPGSETKPGVKIWNLLMAEGAPELIVEIVVSSAVKLDVVNGAWTWAEAIVSSVCDTCVGSEVGVLSSVAAEVGGTAAAWADTGTGGGVWAGTLVSNWAVAGAEIKFGAEDPDKSWPTAVVSPQSGSWPAGNTGGTVSKSWASPRGAITYNRNKQTINKASIK